MTRLWYLGPQGSFTHQAALAAHTHLENFGIQDIAVEPADDVPSIMRHVAQDHDFGVIAWENNIEGIVIPNLDLMIDSQECAGCMRLGVDVSFDAYVRPETFARYAQGIADYEAQCQAVLTACTAVNAHPHGLAQCRAFSQSYHFTEHPADSNAAACRDLCEDEVALGPHICGELYDLQRVATHVEDYSGAHTEFLLIASRDDVMAMLRAMRNRGIDQFESCITFIPLATGPGVLADVLDVMRDDGLNMTSFMSRPIKGHAGTYSFIATVDAAPWDTECTEALQEIASQGDWVKTLAVYPRLERPHPPVDEWMLPQGGVRCNEKSTMTCAEVPMNDLTRKELLW